MDELCMALLAVEVGRNWGFNRERARERHLGCGKPRKANSTIFYNVCYHLPYICLPPTTTPLTTTLNISPQNQVSGTVCHPYSYHLSRGIKPCLSATHLPAALGINSNCLSLLELESILLLHLCIPSTHSHLIHHRHPTFHTTS